jgi:hypothetical protein
MVVVVFGPITDRERLGWQVRALRALADLLAAHPDLPPVTFTVPAQLRAAALLRTLDGAESHRRAVVAAYAVALGTTVIERERSLLASARIDNVEIAVVADLDPAEGADQ